MTRRATIGLCVGMVVGVSITGNARQIGMALQPNPLVVTLSVTTLNPVAGQTVDRPSVGQTVSINISVKNTGTQAVNASYEIKRGADVLQTSTQQLAAGAQFVRQIQWTAVTGSYVFSASAIPVQLLKVASNTVSKNVTVTPLDVQFLVYDTAQKAGATFANNPDLLPPSTCIRAGQMSGPSRSNSDGVSFLVLCGGSPTGAKANPEAFKNFTLKHGWTVKSFAVETISKTRGAATITTPPVIGSANPYVKGHVWADAKGDAEIIVTILIHGVVGTDPYRQ